jgi:Fe-S-cluster containining protein
VLYCDFLGVVEHGAEHLHFACNGCGDCCRTHRVALTHRDLSRLAHVVQAPIETLVDWLPADSVDLDAESGSLVMLPAGLRLMVLAHGNRGCRFLTSDDRCSVYAARPRDCELYPFVLERHVQRQPVRLSLFEPEGCGDRAASPVALADLERADSERWAEIDAYRVHVARWNRLARHRRRLHHRAGSVGQFLDFALRAAVTDADSGLVGEDGAS